MIEIRTSGGVSLDLAPDMEFELIMDNPLLDDEHIPTPFSTSIAFPASPKNKEVFGYVDAMMLRPSQLEIGATIFASGIPIISGTLVYDSVDEKKNICYAFRGADITENWQGKIYEIEGIIPGEYSKTDVKRGLYEDVKAPPMIAEGYETKTAYEPSTDSETRSSLAANPKYYNEFGSDKFIPAVSLALLAKKILGDAGAAPIIESLEGLFIIAPHRDSDNASAASPEIGTFLPDISKADFIKEICRISASYVFNDGRGVRIVKAEDIFDSQEYIDIGDRISDIYSQHYQEPEGYKFGFAESSSPSGGIPESGEDDVDQSIKTVHTLKALLDEPDNEAYKPFLYSPTGDIFSEKRETFEYRAVAQSGQGASGYSTVTRTYEEVLSDRVLDASKNIDLPGESQRDNTLQMQRVRSVPHGPIGRKGRGIYSYLYPMMMPIVSIPEVNADRPTTSYIGAIINNQICDKGCAFANESTDDYIDSSLALVPERLFQLYHSGLASWLGAQRQTIKADLTLSAADVASFRMWQKVLIKHRPFLVKQLSIRFSAGLGIAMSSGEFISI